MVVFIAILFLLATTTGITTGLRCSSCVYAKSHSDCRDHNVCHSSKNWCYMQKIENEHGHSHYKANCATTEECDYMDFKAPVVGKRSPLAKITCERCCNDKDMCNAELCHTSTTTSTTTTTTTTVPPVPVQCEVCNGSLCGLAGIKYSFLCSHERPYCMNTVVNYANGTKHINKSCTTVTDCKNKWWLDSSSKPECQHFEVNNVYPFEFTCNFCCTTDDCNKDLIPKQVTVFKGSH